MRRVHPSSAWLDLNQPEARQKAYELAAGADVFVESYRTRKISNLGLSPEELAARRPGIVYASARCYSYDGPWANRARVRHGSPLRHRLHHRRGNPNAAVVVVSTAACGPNSSGAVSLVPRFVHESVHHIRPTPIPTP